MPQGGSRVGHAALGAGIPSPLMGIHTANMELAKAENSTRKQANACSMPRQALRLAAILPALLMGRL